ncbi:hypothetical protein [Cryptosporangium phraense]|uniref:Uncharacterized protein n=1 Tax=Cryptosporangium phraense TaxID=2593070 RepID=A0A545ASD3_9ACTN|nr:hypothetical protein [Cryptosporangium phraense]TQS43585.1 hypothetical protein FL583_18275 [Cryptosporangium phraense]
MTMLGTHATGALWGAPDPEPPEQAFADVFGDADRVRIALWIDRTAPSHGGLFCADTCANELDLPESTVRGALGPLQHVGMVRYRGGLYARCDHTLWTVLNVYRNYAGPAPTPAPSTIEPPTEPQDTRAATFYFG